MMLDHERRVEGKGTKFERPEYERAGRTRSRMLDKVSEIRRQRGAKKAQYSPHYLRKFIRFAKLVTREQAARPVPYSLQHELIYEGLTSQDRDSFLERCENGEIKTNTELRALVKDLMGRKARASFESSTSTTVPS